MMPEVELMIATREFEDDQEPPVTDEANVVVAPTQIDCVPLSVPAEGGGVIVTRTLSMQVPIPSVTVA